MEKKLHTLPPLPYAYDALEPYIDAETMKIHHDKHHAAYVNNLNAALESFASLAQDKKNPSLFEKSAEDLIRNLNDVPEEIRTMVRNNAGGHVNHSMFWEIMVPQGDKQPKGKLLEEIQKSFGSFEEFQNKFNDVALKRFGSGWVWLVKDKEGRLDIISTQNQDNPMAEGYLPIMGNDVWEHAYYLKYKNMRADYLKNWWNVVNWQEVNRRLNIKN